MDDFMKMDVFFVMTTLVVVLIGTFSLVALYYIIKILRSVDHVAKNVSEESDSLRGDMLVLRQKMRDEGMKMKHMMDFFSSIAERHSGKKRTTKHTVE